MPLFDPIGDFELVADGLAAVTLITRAATEVALTKVLRQEIDRKEVWASNGHYRMGDAVFHLSTTEYAGEPEIGARFRVGDGSEFVVLSVVLDTLGDRWECVGRNLVVSENLTERITILKAGDNLRTPAGALRPAMWIPEAVGVIARLQPMLAERKVEHNSKVFPETATCVFLYAREIDNTRRIQQADGTVWKILKVSHKDRIDMLLEAEVEQTPWPLS